MKSIGLSLLILLVVSACSTAQPVQNSVNQANAEPLQTETLEEPAPYTVTVDDTGCTSDIPETLTLGQHSFLIKNTTDAEYSLVIFMIPEDKTFQDLIDEQAEQGEDYLGVRENEVRTPAKVAQRQDDALGGKFYTFSFYETGDYGSGLEELNGNIMDFVWSFCSPFSVVAE